LSITKEYISDRNRTIELASEKISTTLILVVVYNKITQAVIPKNIVPDPEWFDGD